ncbi:hypothetical protein O181_042706 [Austropuccinia psidii MF-1]|uniref:Uncharacterized protein n=1 Tax=Austropuccinia psidii MF-1 TaxID=1389203 RepID=A0A9Q3HFD0_9BASI|nr:hypothetical protein [Austropuccinia psidii MF-1]
MINMKILRKCGGEIENAIKCGCVELCSTEEYINAMKDMITRKKVGKTWIKNLMESNMIPKISKEDRKPVLKSHICVSTSNLANNCIKKTKINEVQVIENVQCVEEKEESDKDSTVSEDTPVEHYSIENITVSLK